MTTSFTSDPAKQKQIIAARISALKVRLPNLR